MALALYRKYRPRTFAEVIGQDHVTEPLSQALRSGRLHHAYLFSGPRGCGKTSSARILARSLNCEQGPSPDPCGACASCKSLANDGVGSIDVIEIDAASHGGVDDARELREKAFFAPAASRYKIYVIDEAHMVSSAGFNALLKLVEEPPDYVKFIFATTEPEKVLGTIKSRTHHYPFRLIPPAVLRPYLQQLTEAEGVYVEPAVFPLVVRAGAGSARDTLSVLDQLIAGAGPEGVTYARAVALLGVTDVTLIDEMCDALAAGDGATAYATIDRVAEAGHDPRRFASDLLERFRDLIVLQQVPDAVTKGLIDGPADQLEAMGAQATRLGPATLSRCADIVHNGLVEMRGTTAPRLLLELITARMLLPGADDSAGALLQRLERMERRLTLTTDDAEVRPQPASGGSGGGLPAARAAAAAAGRRAPDVDAGVSQAEARSASAATSGVGVSAANAGVPAADPDVSAVATPGVSSQAGGVAPAAAGQPDAVLDPAPSTVTGTIAEPTRSVPPQARRPEAAAAASAGGGSATSDARRPDESAIMPDPPAEPGAEPVSGGAPGRLTAAAVREVWPEIITVVGRHSKKIAALASGATVRDLDGQTVVLTFRFPAHAKMVSDQPQFIVDALYEALGGAWQIRCEVAGEGGGVRGGVGSGPAGGAAPASSRGAAVPAAPRVVQPSRQREASARPMAASAHEGDDWPEPVRPGTAASAEGGGAPAGGSVRSAGAPAGGSSGSDGAPGGEVVASGGATAASGGGAAGSGGGAAGSGGAPAGSGGAPAGGSVRSDHGEPPERGAVTGASDHAVPGDAAAPVTGLAAARAAASGAARPPAAMRPADGASRQSAAKPAGNRPAGGAVRRSAGEPAGVRPADAAARQSAGKPAGMRSADAAARRSAVRPVGAGAAAGAWSDGSPTEEAPYDPEYDGPPPGAVYDGFDPGDEPLDDVIDEKTARQSSEQQAVQLLQEAFGAEKISEG